MSTAAEIMADPVAALAHMAREDEKRQRKHGDTHCLARVVAAFRERAAKCGNRNTCGGCAVCLAVAAELERAP